MSTSNPSFPPIRQDRAQLYPYASGNPYQGKAVQEVFADIFEKRGWDAHSSGESVSGSGSSLSQTQAILHTLPSLLEQYRIQSVLDIPCGDFHWLQHLDWSSRKYTGADIVAPLIRENTKRYTSEQIQFIHADLLQDALPAADLILCRDCLVHFSFQDIGSAISNIKNSSSTYLLTTTFPEQEVNEDIITGGWRPLNMEKPPFNFPKPLFVLNEQCTEMNGAFRDKSLGLWHISTLRQ